MVSTTSIGIGLLIIAIALVVIFISIRKFGLPLLADTGSTFGNFGKGITDFFDRLGASTESDVDRARREQEEIFERQLEEKEQQSIDAGFDSVEEFERATDVTSIFNASLEDLDKFNPPNTIGFGIESLNEGRGIADTPENRQKLLDIIQSAGDSGIFDVRQVDFTSLDVTTSQAFGGFESTEISTIDERDAFIPRTIEDFRAQQVLTVDEPIFISQFDTNQEFQVFSADPNQKVIGVIRETIQDPTQLQVDSFGNPIETASERASRVFEETGQFANESFDIISDAERRAQEFDFGANTGDALKVDFSPELSTAEKLKIEAQKALSEFDSRSISNF